ncbi:MAG: ParB/RepB/Spo0J family partition protein [Planctomycetaceae bacterium]|jgi:ParB-like chromosome segregation protein Spo0J|nr:ParB/RepB/Spo0J family partition protein [Planctomycetaceae bacterium]
MTPNLTINDELKNLLPPLSAKEYAGLEASIRKDGCLSDLIAWDGTLVDGHHRYEICQKHNVPFAVKNIIFENLDEAKLWAGRHQENRRNLTDYHKAELALKLKDVIAAKAKKRQRAAGGDKSKTTSEAVPPTLAEPPESKETRQEIAKIAGISHGNLSKAEYIAEHADEETKEKLRRGEKGTSINKEYNRLKAEEKSAIDNPQAKSVTESEKGDTHPEPPCPNKDVKYFPKTTLKNISQESPHALLANLFTHFRKGFVEELVIMAMEKINEKLGKTAVRKILGVLNKRYGK